MNRRDALRRIGAVAVIPAAPVWADSGLRVAGQDVEIQIAPATARTVRITVAPIRNGAAIAPASNGSLSDLSRGAPVLRMRRAGSVQTISSGQLRVQISPDPLTFSIGEANGRAVQKITVDRDTGVVSFATGDAPLLGLGEGGPQFDRRGDLDPMRSGQAGYQLHTHGGRLPIPWIIGTGGWAIFFHQPFGTFDLTGSEGKFLPVDASSALPLDVFVVLSREPSEIMTQYAELTGYAELPALWTLGYQQSHRTLASREEVLQEAKTFRDKKLPCDAMIYLSTGFCPSGWNTANGSFSWNSRVFPDPKQMIDELHQDHFRVVLHVVILSSTLRGSVRDGCELERFDEEQASCYWDAHRKTFALGVDGWWPDEGDPLDIESRLIRNRMYWEGPQLDRPDERPYALHRNGYAGMQRYGAFLWSGDVFSTWKTLRTHIPIAINTALTGIPYWGTDIGGFVPTSEFTAELYVRWFQFGAFNTLFRAHGRTWKLRLPWGWNTGDPGPVEVSNYSGAATPDASQLHNPDVEPICRKYLELRYRMLPYLYSAVRECTVTGMPVVRALWLHYPDDRVAVTRGDEYLWGRDILVAPVVERGAASRRLYLPRGVWYDYWTGERVEGGREIDRKVDLATMPLYVRAGAIIPLGPVKQYTSEKVDAPLEIDIYSGANGSTLLYEDDGQSFDYRRGEWMGIRMSWDDSRRALTLRLADGSRMLTPSPRRLIVKLDQARRETEFAGRPLEVRF